MNAAYNIDNEYFTGSRNTVTVSASDETSRFRGLEQVSQNKLFCIYRFQNGATVIIPLTTLRESAKSSEDIVTRKSITSSILPSQHALNFNILQQKYNAELERHGHNLPKVGKDKDKAFQSVALLLASLSFENASVEVTPMASIKFSLLLPDNRVVMVTKPLISNSFIGESDVVFSIFINKKLHASDQVTLPYLLTALGK